MPTKEQRKLELFSDLITQIERDTQAKDTTIYPFHEWVLNEKIILDGREFSFEKHEYLIEPYKDDHPFQVEIKATQLGLTSKALLRVVYGCRYGNYRGILYLFPSRTDVTDLSKGRLTPLIEDNPENIGRWIQETDSANIKKIWNSFLYLRGMKSRIGLKCHDDKTEVLTKRGWLLFKDITLNDFVFYKQQFGKPRWKKVRIIHKYKHTGKMYSYESSDVDFCVTGNHRLWLKTSDNFAMLEAENVTNESIYEVFTDEAFTKTNKLPKAKLIDYDSFVYCVSINGGLLFTRRNGKTVWSGNSVPIDFEVFDELDEAPQNAVDMAQERMAHSDVGHQLYLSNPTLPDYGIDKLFQQTDQQYFLLKCRHCNEYNNLVDTFPDCLGIVKGQTLRICKKCGKELDPAYGEWVAKRPSITEKRGRQYSQLYSQMKASSPESILNKFLTTTNLTDFWNLKIGIAYVDAKNRLSREQVFDCCGDQGMLSESSKGCFMGVDQGSNLHFVIGRSHDTRKGEIVHIGHLKGNNTENKNDDSGWRQLDEFMKRFKIMRCVVDAQPNTKLAREFSERFPGRVFLCYYSDSFKGNYRWDEEKMVVHANRTESLDASHMEISQVNVLLPRRSEVVDEFADHLHNVAKKLIVDEETGSQKYQYFRLGEDHWRHAYNYEKMARDESPELMFPDL